MNNLGFILDDNEIVENNAEIHFLDKENFQEKYFISLTLTPGIDLSYSFHNDLNDL